MGFFGTASNIAAAGSLNNAGSSFIGSVTLPSVGRYLLTAQVSIGNGGGGSMIYSSAYINHSSSGIPSTIYGPTGTVAHTAQPYTSNGNGSYNVILNMSNIVNTPAASTVYELFTYVVYTGNCQFQNQTSYFNYVRLS